jgi:hypothetical protein
VAWISLLFTHTSHSSIFFSSEKEALNIFIYEEIAKGLYIFFTYSKVLSVLLHAKVIKSVGRRW